MATHPELSRILQRLDQKLAEAEKVRRIPMTWRTGRRLKRTRAMLRRARYDVETLLAELEE